MVQNDRFAWRFFGPEMAREPAPLLIPTPKPANTIRIFVFGESAAYGDPQPEFGLPRMLEAMLDLRYPGAQFEVYNVAMTAINSHAILPIARECAQQQGDIWVIYMGNNEVVGPFGAGTVFGPQTPSSALVHASLALKSTRTGQFLDELIHGLKKRPISEDEWGGMKMFVNNQVRQTDPHMAAVYSRFANNLNAILKTGRHQGAKMVVGTVAVNLRDCAPFGSLHKSDLSDSDLQLWNTLYQEAQQNGNAQEALDLFRKAATLDDSFAELHFRMGQCWLAMNRGDEAAKEFSLARDLDTLRFRCDSRLNEIIRLAAANREQEGIYFADTESALARQSAQGIPGSEFFYEHVHLTFEGNYFLARTFAEQIQKVLPESVARRAGTSQPWPSLEDCARRLAWTDLNRYEAISKIFNRLDDPPFTLQFNHTEQVQSFRHELENLLPATRSGGLRQAVARCREAVALAPDDWILNKELGNLQFQLGDPAGAADSFKRMVDLMPLYAQSWALWGRALSETKRDDDAMAAFQQASRLDPDSCQILTDKAQILARAGRDTEAMTEFEKILKLKSYWGPAHLGLAELLEKRGQAAEAKKHVEAALQNRMLTPAYLTALATFCFQHGWYASAATNFLDAARLNPSDAALHLNTGVTFGLLNNNAEAERQYAEAVRLDPNLAEARVRLGTELGRQGDTSAALDQFAAATRLNPDMLPARLNYGIALWNLGRQQEAAEQFNEVLKRYPTNSIALEYLRHMREAAK